MRIWLKGVTVGDCRYELKDEQLPPGWKLDAESGDWVREVKTLPELVAVLQPLCERNALRIDVLDERSNHPEVALVLSVEY